MYHTYAIEMEMRRLGLPAPEEQEEVDETCLSDEGPDVDAIEARYGDRIKREA